LLLIIYKNDKIELFEKKNCCFYCFGFFSFLTPFIFLRQKEVAALIMVAFVVVFVAMGHPYHPPVYHVIHNF
jgi:hypothetical protein